MSVKKIIIMAVLALLVLFGFVYMTKGALMHKRVAVEEAKFHQLQESYYMKSKAIRDNADTNSALNRDLAIIQNYPSELLRLKLVGIGNILVGIFLLLLAIVIELFMMPMKLAEFMKGAKKKK